MTMEQDSFSLYEVIIDKDPSRRIDKHRANQLTATAVYPTTIKDDGKSSQVVTKSSHAPNPEVRERILQCAEIHRSLHDHPNITKVLGVKVKHPYVNLIMEKGEGSLRDIFPHNKKLRNEDLRDALFQVMEHRDVAKQMVTGLSYIHSKRDDQNDQFTHRDVKMDNLLIFKRKREEKFAIKYTDFDSARQFDVDDSMNVMTTNVFTELYKDPNLDRLKSQGKPISAKAIVANDVYAEGLTLFELLADGKHLFAGKNPRETMNNIWNCDLSNLFEAEIDPLAKNMIHSMIRQDPEDRITMKEAENVPYFHENSDHIHAICSLSEAILDLDDSDESKRIRKEINESFFMVFETESEWKSLPWVHPDILKYGYSKYSGDFVSYIRYNRNLIQHAEQHKEKLASMSDQPESGEDILQMIRQYAAGTLIHVQWVAKKFFPHLAWTTHFPVNCLRAYEAWMRYTKDRIDENAGELCSKIRPNPKGSSENEEERMMTLFERCRQDIVHVVERNDRRLNALRRSIDAMERGRSPLEEKMKKLTVRGHSSGDGNQDELSRIDRRLEVKQVLDLCEMVRDPAKFRQGASQCIAMPMATQDPPWKQSKGVPAGRRAIYCPPIFKEEWADSQQWPVAFDFIAGEIDGEIYCWGGKQIQPGGRDELLPANAIHCFNPVNQSWRKIAASGDIPSNLKETAGVVCNGMLYIFGVLTSSWQSSNDIFSFSPSSRAFLRLPVVGARPLSRFGHEGWTHNRKLFFFGGWVGRKKDEPAEILTGQEHNGGCDNLLCEFDLETNKWTASTTSGPFPKPRFDFAVAKIENFVFIHGGADGSCNDLKDFSMLNMTSMVWTRLVDAGPTLWYHSLSPISSTQLLTVGGDGRGVGAVHQTWIYDTREAKWRKGEPLPGKIRGHRVVAAKREKGMSLISFGGRIELHRPPDNLYLLDFD